MVNRATPQQQVNPAVVAEYVQYRRPACSERAIATELHHLRLVYPGVDRTWLLAATKRIAAQAKFRPQKHHLITSERLYALGFALMDEAMEAAGAVGAVSKACAFDYRDGLMIALLSAIPIRRRTFAGLRIGTQLVRSGTRPGGNRFNDDNRGAWYCGFDADTAIGEVSYHLTRELEAVGRFENVTDYAELIADFFGPFHDLRGADAEVDPVLHNDPAIAYPAGQTLARQLRIEHASNGIIYPSIRHAGGTCLVCFRPDLVQNLRQGGIWRLEWQGSPMPTVTRQGQ